MKTTIDWSETAFFEEPERDSLDGGTTSEGPLWHAISPRWGHSMHTMCPYHGMFPARLVHYFLQSYSRPGDLVIDPFSGRGTTALQSRAEGRRTISNDLSPLGYVLTAAKGSPPSWEKISAFVAALEKRFKSSLYRDVDVSEDIRMLYHESTLRQLIYLKEELHKRPIRQWNAVQLMLAGAVAGILHGSHRSDGSSMYLSISMPNTFSMAPTYVRKFIRENGLTQIDQNVFNCIRDKLARIYLDSTSGPTGETFFQDAAKFLGSRSSQRIGADLVITSPPYLKVVNYGTSNWIRLWWLGIDDVSRHGGAGRHSLDAQLDHRHTYDSYREFMLRVLTGVRRVLNPDGVAIIVIGDVASPGRTPLPLARQLWSDVGEQTGLRLIKVIEDSLQVQNKVSRIWGETKGQATENDCILVLSRERGRPRVVTEEVDWEEPYRDGGPDEAHTRVKRERAA